MSSFDCKVRVCFITPPQETHDTKIVGSYQYCKNCKIVNFSIRPDYEALFSAEKVKKGIKITHIPSDKSVVAKCEGYHIIKFNGNFFKFVHYSNDLYEHKSHKQIASSYSKVKSYRKRFR